MTAAEVSTQEVGSIFRITLNRPAVHNALHPELIEGLHAALAAAESSPSARVVLLAGEGRSFCAGADIEWMRRQGEAPVEDNERSARRLAALYARIAGLRLPVVARVHGAAIGGGLGLVAASDLAVAAESASFALSEARLGLIAAVISPSVVRKIGLANARDLMLTGRRLGAAEALRIGLVQRVAPDADLDAAVHAVAADIERGGPEAVRRAKELLEKLPALLAAPVEALADYTAREIAAVRASAEGQAGTQAFLEKRDPPWVEKP